MYPLHSYYRQNELSDSNLGIEKIIGSFAQSDSTQNSSSSANPPEGAESTPLSQSTSTPEGCEESVADELERKISSLVAVRVQGSSESLQALLPLVADTIRHTLHQLEQHTGTDNKDKEKEKEKEEGVDEEEGKEVEVEDRVDNTPAPTSAPITSSAWYISAVSALSNYLDPVILGEKIKSVAARTPHGYRGKGALLFEDTDPAALWRWETLRYSRQRCTILLFRISH